LLFATSVAIGSPCSGRQGEAKDQRIGTFEPTVQRREVGTAFHLKCERAIAGLEKNLEVRARL
jgi:hypothetical protein